MTPETARYLVARLNAKTSSWQAPVQGLQGGLTSHDIAMAMVGCSPIDEWIARLSLAGQQEYREPVRQWLVAVAIKLSDKWGSATFEHKKAVADIVLQDMLPDRLCPVCKGRKSAPNHEHKIIECMNCNGRGWILLTDEGRGKILGMSRSNYQRIWRDRVNLVIKRYQAHESIAINAIVKHFANP